MYNLDLKNKIWWNYLDEDLKDLLRQSFFLWNQASEWKKKYNDYSFVVFPAAKAYEGYLKLIFFKIGFITKDDYYGKHFRIGKALNPSLDAKFSNENIYQKLVNYCNGIKTPDVMWNAWKVSRNVLFHYFPDEKNAITLEESRGRIETIINAMDEAHKGCKIKI